MNKSPFVEQHAVEKTAANLICGGWIMKIEWVDGFEIKTVSENGEIVISANREGMLSLANHLTALADGMPGDHIHYDENNALEEGSTELIIERI